MRIKNKNRSVFALYDDVIQNNIYLNSISKNGIILLHSKNPIKKVLGYSIITIGLITFFIPLITLPLILFGCSILNLSYYKIKEEIKHKIFMLKYKCL